MAILNTSATAIVAGIYDDVRAASAATVDVAAGKVAIGQVRRIDPQSDDAVLDALGLPAVVVERYRAALWRGRTIILVEVDASNATATDILLRQHEPLETAVHSREASFTGDPLPPPVLPRPVLPAAGHARPRRQRAAPSA